MMYKTVSVVLTYNFYLLAVKILKPVIRSFKISKKTLTYFWYKNIDIFVKRSNDNSSKIEKDSKHRPHMLTYSTENQEQSMDDSIAHQNCTF